MILYVNITTITSNVTMCDNCQKLVTHVTATVTVTTSCDTRRVILYIL